MSAEILCIGEPMLEFNQQPDGRYLPGHGGDVSNCAIAAARSGASVGMVTRLSADPFGESFLDLWRAEGVDAAAVTQDPDAPTGIYFVTHGPGGHAFSYFRAGFAASRMGPWDLPLEAIRSAKFIHVSGISQAISAGAVFAAVAAVAATGAGDTFDGAFLAELVVGREPFAAARYANAAAAL